jgi:hypothetical protein
MEIRIRLGEILEELGEYHHGIITEICKHTNLERHQVTSFLNNTVKRVPLNVLESICKFLIEKYHMDPDQLPGKLFSLEMGEFWTTLAQRPFIAISSGMRKGNSKGEHRWAMASDYFLNSALLHEIFSVGQRKAGSMIHFLEQKLVSAFYDETPIDAIRKEARQVYRNFSEVKGGKALICLGSIKSNILVESIMSNLFMVPDFESQDNVDKPSNRRCPVYVYYRSCDPKPPSCHGGVQLSKRQRKKKPGIYFELPDGKWKACVCGKDRSGETDAALVTYVFRPNLGIFEMVMGGFSGRATECLASSLDSLSDRLWPPTYRRKNLQVGVFVVEFKLDGTTRSLDGAAGGTAIHKASKISVHRIHEKVLAKRFERGKKRDGTESKESSVAS